jgi:hypothetical protein
MAVASDNFSNIRPRSDFPLRWSRRICLATGERRIQSEFTRKGRSMKLDKLGVKLSRGLAVTGVALCLLMPSCSTTAAPSQNIVRKMEGEAPPLVKTSGFLGDYSQLQPGKEGQTALVYINPNAQWAKYTKVIIDPVQFWAGADTGVPTDDQQILCEYFYNKVAENLQNAGYTSVTQPGPDVMRLRIALTDANAATPGLRSVSVVIPQARILNLVQSMGTGSYAFVGGAASGG